MCCAVALRPLAVRNQLEESLVNPRVVGELGMESGGHRSSLPDHDGIGSFGRQHFDIIADVGNFGCADKHHFEWRFRQLTFEIAQKFPLPDRAVDLASIRVASNADIKSAEAGLCRVLHFGGEKDGARTSSERGLGSDKLDRK